MQSLAEAFWGWGRRWTTGSRIGVMLNLRGGHLLLRIG